MTARTEILLDGKPRLVPEGCTLAQLMDELGLQPADATTAVNGQFVPRGERAIHRLQPADSVLLFQAIVGG
jgi:sulfur carrier protein